MKLSELDALEARKVGYRVSFERRERGMLISDHLPDHDEAPDGVSREAVEALRDRLLKATDPHHVVNVYLVDARFTPIPGYRETMQRPYPIFDAHSG